jgi:hypothetical protein
LARKVGWFAAGWICGIALGTLVVVSHAADPGDADAQVQAAATLANVDPVDLQGAMNSTGADDPYAYLRSAGDLPPLKETVVPPAPAAAPSGPPIGVWDRLAQCESGGNWASVSNPRYKGGLQMDSTFWARYGGLAYASAPQYASRSAQIAVAIRGQAVQGFQAWPVCGKRLGLY